MSHQQAVPHENPLLSRVVQRNLHTLFGVRKQADESRGIQDRLADTITAMSGRMAFVYLHMLWFGGWIIANTGKIAIPVFDPFPYGLLTMIVSLEAIFLATFLLISQNRQAEEAEHRADLALQIGLLTEHELTRVLRMLDTIQTKLGIVDDESELADLEMETRPEDVLAEVVRLRREAHR